MEVNLADLFTQVADAVPPDRECIVRPDLRLTYRDVAERTRRLANVLVDHGFEVRSERSSLANHESGQDHLALYLYNGNEYLEGMLGAYEARAVPFNVNYRYVAEELEYLLSDAGARGVVYHASFAPVLAEVRDRLPALDLLLQVDDGSGNDLLPGALDYEEALAASSPERPDLDRPPDDLYMLYTGGTTGAPKGVIWRQDDIWVAALGGTDLTTQTQRQSLDEVLEEAANGGARGLPAPPFMHGAAHWAAFVWFTRGDTIVLPGSVRHLDAADVLSTIERESVSTLLIVGDAFGGPLADELETGDYDLGSLVAIVSGGAPLHAALKDRILARVPNALVVDGLGASETGGQAAQVSAAGAAASTGSFSPGPNTFVLSEDLTRILQPGDGEMGWLAQTGRLPLGYLGDADKTARTFPVVDDVRCAVPGDRARVAANGDLELFGRDSVTVNSGGEKIFVEEVEKALRHHPDVLDTTVCGRPSERWGSEVVAIVRLREGAERDEASLLAEAGNHLARFKLPKAFVFVDEITRSPSGKADYRWASEVAVAG